MSRATLAWDRVAATVVALVLLAAAVFGIVWWSDSWSVVPDTLELDPVLDVLGEPWWPWVAGAAAVLLGLLGLRWLLAHVPSRGVGTISLPGSGRGGRLRTDANRVTDAAAESLADTHGVRAASGSMHRDRGQLVAKLAATIEPEADLELVAQAADRVSAELAKVVGRDDLHCRVQLSVAARNRAQARVR